jgi:hypothetical protein
MREVGVDRYPQYGHSTCTEHVELWQDQWRWVLMSHVALDDVGAWRRGHDVCGDQWPSHRRDQK